jgi:DNA (cytosine-5)-methyltransferase 1
VSLVETCLMRSRTAGLEANDVGGCRGTLNLIVFVSKPPAAGAPLSVARPGRHAAGRLIRQPNAGRRLAVRPGATGQTPGRDSMTRVPGCPVLVHFGMPEARQRGSEQELCALDAFSGCGGLSLGLKRAGFRIAGAIEIDPLAVETYRLNHAEVEAVWECDIRELTGTRILEDLGLARGELDLLAGCPPCQGFSSMTTLNGKRRVVDDRNQLIEEFARLVDELRPKAVLMENVPGLAGDQRFKRLLKRLSGSGYDVDDGVRILDAADFGVPQHRRRLVLMASLAGKLKFARSRRVRRSVRDAIGGLGPAGRSGDPLHDLPERRSESVAAMIAAIPKNGGGRLDLPLEKQLACHRETTGFKDVYGRMAWDRPAPTITGGCHNPSKGRFLHPRENRAITLREAALLQGFPRDYKFSTRRGKLAAAAMIGNALPPDFVASQARVIARSIRATAGPL